ncbi:MAG TPA: nuclease, partial [Candidatus Krumholzibacteria bacterium]
MRLLDSEIRLSASDLSNHLGCRHLTWLDLRAATGEIEPPDHHDPRLEALIERGFQHEAAFLDHLEGKGRAVTRLPKADDTTSGTQQTIAAMQAGAGVIVQATLTSGRWLGYADVLLRVETPSDLGGWSYEVLDTKLA